MEKENRKELEIGSMAQLDVVSAQSQVAATRRDLIVAQTNEQIAELQLKSMISRNLDEPLASAPIETADPLPEPDDTPIPPVDSSELSLLVDVQRVIDAHPSLTVMIFEERCDLIARQTFPRLK